MNHNELIANLETCAAKLAGRAVIVRIRKPAGANGCAAKDLQGRAVIDLDPALFEPRRVDDFAHIFTHEAAHVKKHFHEMPRVDVDAPPSMKNERKLAELLQLAAKVKPEVKRRETEAETLAADWREVVNRHYVSYIQAEQNPIMAVLKILYQKT